MRNKKRIPGRKLKICRNLLICFFCITFSFVNVYGLSNLNEYTDDGTKTQIVEETVEYEEKEAADEQTAESDLVDNVPDLLTEQLPIAEVDENIEDTVIGDPDIQETEVSVGNGTDKADVKPSAEPEQQEEDEPPIIAVPFTLDQTPVIDAAILANSTNKVVVINEADSTQLGCSTLQAAMQAIGMEPGNYTIVFVQNYNLTTADKDAVTANGENAQLTITSTYKDDTNATIRRSLGWLTSSASTWTCNSDTTFKDITFSYFHIYGNCHKLIIDTGVICTQSASSIFGGGSTGKIGNADVTVLSGSWTQVKSGGNTGTMDGSADICIGGTAKITSLISAAAGVTGKVTVNVDGSDGATVQSFDDNTAADEFNINLNNSTIIGNLYLGNADLSISGTCTVGSSITAGTTAEITIKLNDGASLSNGTTGYFNCPEASLVFGAGSKLTCNGTTNCIGDLVIEGDGAELNVKQGQPMIVSGTFTGEHKLNIDLVNATTPAHFDTFLTFTTAANANEDNYTYLGNRYDDIVTVNGSVIYFDFIPPEGYIYNWYGTESIHVGGHDETQNVNDIKCEFGLKTDMSQDAFRLWSGQLTGKINGYMDGLAFTNYFRDKHPDFKYSIKVGSNVYYLTGGNTGAIWVIPHAVFRGYQKSADGSKLDLVFYLGKDVGIVYLHLIINPESTIMSESWDYVNLSNNVQNIVMSHGGDITYAGKDNSYCISKPGWDIAFAFHTPSAPVMFMWVDQITTSNPAVAGNYQAISRAVGTGNLYESGLANTVTFGGTIDTGMGIQWQYSVPAGATQSASGGTAFGNLGNLQFSGKDVTFINPGKEDTNKTVAHSVINVSNSAIMIAKDDWSIEGLPDGITVTGIPDTLTVSGTNTANFNLTYSADLSVLPGIYPVDYNITQGTNEYTFTDNITVIRDEVKITTEVRNEDESENTTAISGIAAAATSPVTGTAIYKYYDGRLSWLLDSLNYEIKKITVKGTELTAAELARAKANNYLAFDEMQEDKAVVIYVGEPSEEPKNKITVSKTAAGGPAGRSFGFTITVKDQTGAALTEGTELGCRGGVIADSGAAAPDITTLILDANGQAEFDLANGQMLEIINIPAEGRIQVVEAEAAGYTAAHTVDGIASAAADQKDTGLLDMESTDKVIAFHNTHLNDLAVSKTVGGEFGDKTKAFSFNIAVKDAEGNNVTKDFNYEGGALTGSAYKDVTAPANGILSISNGTGSFTLRHGQSMTIKHLDPTYKIQITETDPGTLYDTKYSKGGVETEGRAVSEFILGGEKVTIDYTNTRDMIPATGIPGGSDTWIHVLGIVLVLSGISGLVTHFGRKAG